MTHTLHSSFLRFVGLVAAIFAAILPAGAFDLATYAEQSALASGRWVKIGVESSGIYAIPASTLRSWGFNDPAKVRIHGYGGRRIDNVMSQSNYVDDLPLVQSELTDAGLVFYALGPDQMLSNAAGGNPFYHIEKNTYTGLGYYFVTESDDEPAEIAAIGHAGAGDTMPVTTAMALYQYERDLVRATEAGPLLVGEDFRYSPSQNFDITLPGLVEGGNVAMECQFISAHVGTSSQLAFSLNGKALPAEASDNIPATAESGYVHGSLGISRRIITPESEKFVIGIRHSCSIVVQKANLDYLAFSYDRKLQLPSEGYLNFMSNAKALSLGGADGELRVWDVTVPSSITKLNYSVESGRATWQPSYSGVRTYIAWRPGANLPQPKFVANVVNQNLHGDNQPVEMVIFTTPALANQANRIAELHRTVDGMKVSVVDVNKVYNEFSSGMADVSGLRKYLKMVYDRGLSTDTPLRYALLLGRTTLDHQALLATTRALGYETMPAWVVSGARNSLSDNDGFTTDDFIAMLDDDSGADLGLDNLCIAVGRIPMISDHDGGEIVDKLYQYVNKSRRGGWKNRLLALADDGDSNVHMRDTEKMVKNIFATPGQQHLITKVYLGSYNMSSGVYPEARREMFQTLDDGVAWWFFAGHANNHSWTGEGQFTYTDMNNLYLRNLPVLMAATCDFLRWDSETTSGGEILYKERYGGVIAMISATRPVFISDNGYFTSAIGRALLSRDEQGRFLTAGEVYRRAKNDILNNKNQHLTNPNRLRFVFMGDPAMRTVMPDNIVEVLTINGKPVDPDAQITIAALENVTITGRITDSFGQPINDFNGTVNIELFDATNSRVAKDEDKSEPFDVIGDKLYAGAGRVTAGEFSLSIAMPSLVTDNFRPATMSLYASADNSAAEAIGANSDFFVYGFKEPETADTEAPAIESMVLNHVGFESGQMVNSSPMLIARVSDNIGINLSNAGVGQQITATLDGTNTFSDVASFYTPDAEGSPAGTINYPFENIADGQHTLRLRVFDTSGNAAERTIEFSVDQALVPMIFEVFTDASPAIESANFYVRHDRPEEILDVTVEVFDLLGHPIWSGHSKGLSDADVSAPVTWNLTDVAGHRVNRGIYLYRASISTDNANYVTASRRIAVTGK